MNLTASDLTTRVTFQARAAGQDAHGAPSGAWADVFSCWAKEEPLTSTLWFAAQQEQSGVTTRFFIRWRDDVVPGMRIRNAAGELFDIVGQPLDLKQATGRWMQLMGASGVRDGR